MELNHHIIFNEWVIVSLPTDPNKFNISIKHINILINTKNILIICFLNQEKVIKAQNITDEGIAPIKTDVTQSINPHHFKHHILW